MQTAPALEVHRTTVKLYDSVHVYFALNRERIFVSVDAAVAQVTVSIQGEFSTDRILQHVVTAAHRRRGQREGDIEQMIILVNQI